MISALILTRNEQTDLPGCIQSIKWCDDIHVFDSFSDDDTVAIARDLGAQVSQREFDNYAAQRNSALQSLPFRHQWLLILDADERVPSALADEMAEFIGSAGDQVAACRMRRRDYFGSTWLRHAQMSPFYIRLVRPDRSHYVREVNEVLRVDGEIHDLSQAFDHYPFSKGIAHWLAKHNTYSSMEAELAAESKAGRTPFSLRKALFARDFNQRRYHQKEIFYRLPFRPMTKFFYLYVLRRGFLDGYAGFAYSVLQAFYEYMIVLKTLELQSQPKAAVSARSQTQPAHNGRSETLAANRSEQQ